MKPNVSSSRAVAALAIGGAVACACGSSQKQLTAPQQAAANAEEQAQKAQDDAQKARDEANKTQKDLVEAQQAHNEAQAAELAADQKAQVASHQAGMAEQQAGMAARPPPAPPPAAPEKGAAEAQGGPHAGHDSAGKVVVITASLLFKSGSAELLPSAKPKLDDVAQALSAQPQANDVKVQGYTDNTGSTAINDPLSQQRAQAVADYLESKGVPQDRIQAQGFGKQDPVSKADTTEGRALNRRVDIVIEPVAGEPGKAAPGNAPTEAMPPEKQSPQQQPSQGQPSKPQP
ncbi:MAG TPA: OmpA family protein [Polyangiaceae bacterium]|jgi:outer membrane protein OmpA-like peptidoglycan-associated protein|nr:OmpA family protein [Polyangiaceae bacterium]